MTLEQHQGWLKALNGSTRDCPMCGAAAIERVYLEGKEIGHYLLCWCQSCRTGVSLAGLQEIPAGESVLPATAEMPKFRMVGMFDADRSWLRLVEVVQRQSGIRLHAGLTDAELRQFQDALPGPLPSDVLELLRRTAGFDVPGGEPVDFTGRSHRFDLGEVFHHPLALASTVTGDFWVVDVARDGTWGPVYYACHDPWFIGVAFDSLRDFIEHAARPERLREKADTLTRPRH